MIAKEIWFFFCTLRFHFIDSRCPWWKQTAWFSCAKNLFFFLPSLPTPLESIRKELPHCSSWQVNGTCALIYCSGCLPWPRGKFGYQPGRWHSTNDLSLITAPHLLLTQLIRKRNPSWAGFQIQPHFDFLKNKDDTSTQKHPMPNSVNWGTKLKKAPLIVFGYQGTRTVSKIGLQSWLSWWRSGHFYWLPIIKILEGY